MGKGPQNAISPTREEDYPEWYQQVIKAADLAETSPVRGCMVIKPWGYGIWERIQRELDNRIKATGHENAYFPLLIPLSFLEREAAHVEGFAKECAVVTHHRLEERDGKLIPTGELEEPLIIRPTSETIIGESFSRWVQSYRDLPLLINQWANVMRWEMRTRLFLRTAEFLWQEGHTVHADKEDALRETHRMLEVYRELAEDVMAMPVICGEKSVGERFPGAENTFAIEAMMQDRKALQAGTSHYLGENFARAAEIKYLDREGELRFAHTTSWGVSTRLVGGLIMTHGDDDGMRVPPKLAPQQAVILPVIPKDGNEDEVFRYADELAAELRQRSFAGEPLRVQVDKRDIRGGEKSWQWVKKGAPLRIEVGPRDIEAGKAVVFRRDRGAKEKEFLERGALIQSAPTMLEEIQNSLFEQARTCRDSHLETGITSWDELQSYFSEPESGFSGGFARVKWDQTRESEERLAELKASIRCIPFDQSGEEGKCVISGAPAKTEVIVAKAY